MREKLKKIGKTSLIAAGVLYAIATFVFMVIVAIHEFPFAYPG